MYMPLFQIAGDLNTLTQLHRYSINVGQYRLMALLVVVAGKIWNGHNHMKGYRHRGKTLSTLPKRQ
jgi:hypothetical protein